MELGRRTSANIGLHVAGNQLILILCQKNREKLHWQQHYFIFLLKQAFKYMQGSTRSEPFILTRMNLCSSILSFQWNRSYNVVFCFSKRNAGVLSKTKGRTAWISIALMTV